MAELEVKPNPTKSNNPVIFPHEKPLKQEIQKSSVLNNHKEVDKFISDSSADQEDLKESVSFKQAFKSFFNGLISPVTTLLKSPLAWAFLIGGGLLAAVIPVTVPIMFAVGLLVSSGYLAKGITNAIIAGVNGDGKRFANAFENIGTGTIGILLARLSVGRAAREAINAKDRAAFPFFLPPSKSNCYEICTLFTTKSGWKAIGTAFRYPKGIKLSLGTLKFNLQLLTSHRPGTPSSTYSGWGDWFGHCMSFIGRFLPTLNQPLGFR